MNRLTASEEGILEALRKSEGKVVSRTDLIKRCVVHSGVTRNFYFSNIVDVHIKNLRRKIAPREIETIRGKGYRLV